MSMSFSMKTVKIILSVAIIFSFINCHAQKEEMAVNKSFQVFLEKFETAPPPLVYKKIAKRIPKMTKEEAFRFLHKDEKDLIRIVEDMGEGEVIESYIEESSPGCGFKYRLNDSILVLFTREGGGMRTGIIDTSRVFLNTFTIDGELIKKCLVGEVFDSEFDWVTFALPSKNQISIFYYKSDYTRKDEGFRATVYHINYIITDDGQFIKKDKSDIIYLKDSAIRYNVYDPNSDDPMNEYDF